MTILQDKELSLIINIYNFSILENNTIYNKKFVKFFYFLIGILQANFNNSTKFMANYFREIVKFLNYLIFSVIIPLSVNLQKNNITQLCISLINAYNI
jgi:hypothetical protein